MLYLLGVCSGCTEGEAELSQALTAAVDHLPAGSTAGKQRALKKKKNGCFLSSDFPYPRGPSFRVLLVPGKGSGFAVPSV